MDLTHDIRKLTDISHLVTVVLSSEDAYSVKGGTINTMSLVPTYDANGNILGHGSFTITSGTTQQFELKAVAFTYDRNNRLKTCALGAGATCTLFWDALGRIREKTWTGHHQVFYHDGRQLSQIWEQTVNGSTVTRTIAYDLFRGQTGYLKDIDFVSNSMRNRI